MLCTRHVRHDKQDMNVQGGMLAWQGELSSS